MESQTLNDYGGSSIDLVKDYFVVCLCFIVFISVIWAPVDRKQDG